MEPHPQSQTQLRDEVREKLHHWTLWRSADEVIPELNRMLKGWGGYCHYARSTRVLERMNPLVVNRGQRWLGRKGGGRKGLWATTPREVLSGRWGLYRLPTWAAWKRAAA